MYWLFSILGALLVAALLTYLLATAFGRGEELPAPTAGPLEQEHRHQLEKSPINAQGVSNVRFTQSLRGYKQSEVDAYLLRVQQQLAEYEQRFTELRQPDAGQSLKESNCDTDS